MIRIGIIALFVLAGCGVEDAPEPVPGGVQVGGSASIGVRGSF